MEGLLRLGQHRSILVAAALLDGGEGQQDAALRIDLHVGVGGRGQLAGGSHPASPLGTVALTDSHEAGDERADQDERGRREQGAESPVLAGLVSGPVLGGPVLGVGEGLAGAEERALGRRQVGRDPLAPLEGLGEAGTAIQLAVGTAHCIPCLGGTGEVAQDALSLDVVVEPAPQAGPGSGQRLVGELDDAVVAGDEPGARRAAR